LMEYQVEKAYHDIKETVEKRLESCGYSVVDLTKMYSLFSLAKKETKEEEETEGFSS
jgi:hypothetical protein